MTDKINPDHYKSGGMEVIDVIEAFKLDFKLANAVKYILRAGKKPGQTSHDDLKKAIWYINRHIEKEPNCHAMTMDEIPKNNHGNPDLPFLIRCENCNTGNPSSYDFCIACRNPLRKNANVSNEEKTL